MASRVEKGIQRKKKEKKKAIVFGLIALFISVTVISYTATTKKIQASEELKAEQIDTAQLIRDMLEKNKQKEKEKTDDKSNNR